MPNMKLALLALVPSLALAQVTASVQTTPLPGGPITSGDDTALWQLADGGAVILVTNSATNQTAGVTAYGYDGGLITGTVDGPAVGVDVRYGLAFDGGTVDVVMGMGNDGTFRLYTPGSAGLLSHLTLTASMGTQIQPSAAALGWHDDKLYVFVGGFTGEVQQWEVQTSGSTVTFAKVADRQLGTRTIKALAADEFHDRLLVSMAGSGLGHIPLDPNADAGFKVIDKEDGGSLGASPSGIAVLLMPDLSQGAVTLVSDNVNDRIGLYVADALIDTVKVGQNGIIDALTGPLGLDVLVTPQPNPFQIGTLAVVDGTNNAGPNAKLVPWAAIISLSDQLPSTAFDPRTLPHHKPLPDAGCMMSDAGSDGGLDGGDGGSSGNCGAGGGGGGSGGTGGIHINPNPGEPYVDHHCGCVSIGAFGGALWLLGLALRRKLR
jgi:myo-inositol-hexaphosphate 3-phosphohydrolase